MTKYFFFITGLIFFLGGCALPQESTENLSSSNQTHVGQEQSLKNKAPSLPSLPKKSTQKVVKEPDLNSKNLPTPPKVMDVQNLISKQPSALADSKAMEAMNLKSKKSCESFEAEILKQICYNSRGLSSTADTK